MTASSSSRLCSSELQALNLPHFKFLFVCLFVTMALSRGLENLKAYGTTATAEDMPVLPQAADIVIIISLTFLARCHSKVS